MSNLFDVRFYNGSRFIAYAENIVAWNEQKAVRAALGAISSRGRMSKNEEDLRLLGALAKHLDLPKIHEMPEGVRVFVAQVNLGQQVI